MYFLLVLRLVSVYPGGPRLLALQEILLQQAYTESLQRLSSGMLPAWHRPNNSARMVCEATTNSGTPRHRIRTHGTLSFANQLCAKPTKLLQGGNLLPPAVSLSSDFQIFPGITTLSGPPARVALSHKRMVGQVPPCKSRSNS